MINRKLEMLKYELLMRFFHPGLVLESPGLPGWWVTEGISKDVSWQS